MKKSHKEIVKRIVQAEIDFNKKVLTDNGHTRHHPLNLLVDIMGIQRAHENAPERNRL